MCAIPSHNTRPLETGKIWHDLGNSTVNTYAKLEHSHTIVISIGYVDVSNLDLLVNRETERSLYTCLWYITFVVFLLGNMGLGQSCYFYHFPFFVIGSKSVIRMKIIQGRSYFTRIKFFRKNYREIHGNQGIHKFLGIFTVFTVIFTGNHGNFYRNSW